MHLGQILATMETEGGAAEWLETTGDIVLLAEVEATSTKYGESVGEYVAGAARRFAAGAGDEAWVGLVGAIERGDDPAKAALHRIVEWALRQDQEVGCGEGACQCSRKGDDGST
jgi:hypothetical protein